MAEMLELTVVTPAGIAWQKQASSVVLQTQAGEIDVLPGHAPLVTLLEPGEMWIVHGETEELFAAGEGFAEISPERVTIFSDLAEPVESIALDATESAKKRAEQALAESARMTEDERRAA